MTVEAAAVCPGTPLLCPDVAVTPDGVAAAQSAARAAVAALVAAPVDEVVVVGEAPTTDGYDGSWDWRGFGVDRRGGDGAPLPRALGVGAWLLDDARWAGRRRYLGVSPATPPEECERLGAGIRDGGTCVAVLAIADGSARRSLKAPGHLDERAEPFDDMVAAALGGADLAALRSLDPHLASELMAAGRAPWQVLAAAGDGVGWDSRLLLQEAPYGVGWLVASWHRNTNSNFL